MSQLHYVSHPVSKLEGSITVPGDKSISHRAIILSAIAVGSSHIQGFLASQDCLMTLNAFESMGVSIERKTPESLIVHGVGKQGLKKPNTTIDCGNSGTSMRLLTGLLAGQTFDAELTGDDSLKKRPMERIKSPLTQMGADITTNNGLPPILVHGNQPLQGISYEMPIASAQVKSAILLAGLYAEGETSIIEPLCTRDHTERMLTAFSYPIHKSDNTVSINANSECLATEITIPGDFSSAAFFIVAATLIPGSNVLIRNVGINPTRTGLLTILGQMGANIEIQNKRLYGEELTADLLVKYAPLEGIDIHSSLVPLAIDEFPIIFIAAAKARGQTRLHGAKELRCKESDRITAMVNGLQLLGIEALAFEDGVHIHGGELKGGVVVDSQHDHRIAMSFAIAGALATKPIGIKHCGSVATSFPDFVKTAKALQLAVMETYDNLNLK